MNRNRKPRAKYVFAALAMLLLICSLIAAVLLGAAALQLASRATGTPPMALPAPSLQHAPDNGYYKAGQGIELQEAPNAEIGLTDAEIYGKSAASVVDIFLLYPQFPSWQHAGTGVIISEDGLIISSAYIFAGAEYCKVVLATGEELEASLVGIDDYSGLAVISVAASGLPKAELAETSALQIGERVVAIGTAAGGFSGSMSQGIISGLSRDVSVSTNTGLYNLSGLIQIDKALFGGNYGGAILNCYGQVIGISTPYGEWETGEVGFAIPSSSIKPVVDAIIALGYVPRAALGITAAEISEEECAAYRLPTHGLVIQSISEESGLAKMGVKVGDFIFAIDDVEINTTKELVNAVQKHSEGEQIKVLVCSVPTFEICNYNVILLGNSR